MVVLILGFRLRDLLCQRDDLFSRYVNVYMTLLQVEDPSIAWRLRD